MVLDLLGHSSQNGLRVDLEILEHENWKQVVCAWNVESQWWRICDVTCCKDQAQKIWDWGLTISWFGYFWIKLGTSMGCWSLLTVAGIDGSLKYGRTCAFFVWKHMPSNSMTIVWGSILSTKSWSQPWWWRLKPEPFTNVKQLERDPWTSDSV